MNEPPPSAQGEPNPAGDKPGPSADAPPPRPRSRKPRLAFAAFGLVLVAVVVLFRPYGPGSANSVHLQLQTLTTNAHGTIEAVFLASNRWPRQADLMTVRVERTTAIPGTFFYEPASSNLSLLPGKTALIPVLITNPPPRWRIEVVWMARPSRLTIWAWNFRAAVGRIVPAVDPDRMAWFHRHARTNHWPEPAP